MVGSFGIENSSIDIFGSVDFMITIFFIYLRAKNIEQGDEMRVFLDDKRKAHNFCIDHPSIIER